ncbi:MAG: hypothetical protein MZV70_73060 [Desulfobacterales bacterium]|nr:hypothetical protein [Desulfobacterales bacterium]
MKNRRRGRRVHLPARMDATITYSDALRNRPGRPCRRHKHKRHVHAHRVGARHECLRDPAAQCGALHRQAGVHPGAGGAKRRPRHGDPVHLCQQRGTSSSLPSF